MNAIGAKIVKAEIMGNDELVTKLKQKLADARAAKKEVEEAKARGEIDSEEETIILTKTDAKGFSRPVGSEVVSAESTANDRRRNKKKKVETHGKDGQRERYFPDDDKYSLKEMFEREKLSTAEDQNGMMSRLAGNNVDKTDEEYDLDDMFVSRASAKTSDARELERERDRAIAEHRRMERTLDSCARCFNSAQMQKHLLIALGRTCYLALPAHASLTEGHALIVPLHHATCATTLDEDVWEEMQMFRKALTRMYDDAEFDEDREDVVFFESAVFLKSRPHMVLEAVPLSREAGETAPMYFQKAIQECESEWTNNKKLIDLREKGLRRSIPKGLPYFHVDFGTQDGFAHVIEDEKDFPRNFAQGSHNFIEILL